MLNERLKRYSDTNPIECHQEIPEMASNSVDQVSFDVLLRTAGSGRIPTVENIHEFHASAEEIEKCRRWFASQGITCHATQFGLACNAKRESFESIFGVRLTPTQGGPGVRSHQMSGEPKPPAEIADLIDQITLSAPPELF